MPSDKELLQMKRQREDEMMQNIKILAGLHGGSHNAIKKIKERCDAGSMRACLYYRETMHDLAEIDLEGGATSIVIEHIDELEPSLADDLRRFYDQDLDDGQRSRMIEEWQSEFNTRCEKRKMRIPLSILDISDEQWERDREIEKRKR